MVYIRDVGKHLVDTKLDGGEQGCATRASWLSGIEDEGTLLSSISASLGSPLER